MELITVKKVFNRIQRMDCKANTRAIQIPESLEALLGLTLLNIINHNKAHVEQHFSGYILQFTGNQATRLTHMEKLRKK